MKIGEIYFVDTSVRHTPPPPLPPITIINICSLRFEFNLNLNDRNN